MTVAELLGRMSGAELADWQAYEAAHGPLGPIRGDWQAATIAATIANANRGKRGRVAKVKDFLLEWKGGAGSAMSAIETERVGRLLASRLGGTWTEARDGGEP
jgi:hypothetical protein